MTESPEQSEKRRLEDFHEWEPAVATSREIWQAAMKLGETYGYRRAVEAIKLNPGVDSAWAVCQAVPDDVNDMWGSINLSDPKPRGPK